MFMECVLKIELFIGILSQILDFKAFHWGSRVCHQQMTSFDTLCWRQHFWWAPFSISITLDMRSKHWKRLKELWRGRLWLKIREHSVLNARSVVSSTRHCILTPLKINTSSRPVSVKNVINIDFKSATTALYHLLSIGVLMWWNFLDLYLNGKITSSMITILIEFLLFRIESYLFTCRQLS